MVSEFVRERIGRVKTETSHESRKIVDKIIDKEQTWRKVEFDPSALPRHRLSMPKPPCPANPCNFE